MRDNSRRSCAALLAVLCAALLAGCMDEQGQGAAAQEQDAPQTHTIIEDRRFDMDGGGGWAMQPFEITRTACVDYSIIERNDRAVDVCILAREEAQYWENGQRVRGWACHDNVASYSDYATLAAGAYRLALRCDTTFSDCTVTASLYVTA